VNPGHEVAVLKPGGIRLNPIMHCERVRIGRYAHGQAADRQTHRRAHYNIVARGSGRPAGRVWSGRVRKFTNMSGSGRVGFSSMNDKNLL